jgi:hypothetical protein
MVAYNHWYNRIHCSGRYRTLATRQSDRPSSISCYFNKGDARALRGLQRLVVALLIAKFYVQMLPAASLARLRALEAKSDYDNPEYGKIMMDLNTPFLRTSTARILFGASPGKYAYLVLASRNSLVRRSSYSSFVISPAAYLFCRSCRGDCICR